MFKWVLWELKPGNKHAWNESLMQIATFDSVEDFWMVHTNALPPSQLPLGSDYYLFREGIKPNWEDAMNVKGGRWLAIIPNKSSLPRDKVSSSNLDKYWLNLMMSVIGAQYGVDNDKVCGVAAHLRKNHDKVALWISDVTDGESHERIGQTFQETLRLVNLSDSPLAQYVNPAPSVSFDTHSDSFRRYSNNPNPFHGGGAAEVTGEVKQLQKTTTV